LQKSVRNLVRSRFDRIMRNIIVGVVCAVFMCVPAMAEIGAETVVFSEPGFPVADSATASTQALQELFSHGRFASAEELSSAVSDSATRLLVLPYGSAFPEQSWDSLYQFLQKGGNLLVMGGRPFTRSAYREGAGWKLRDYSVRFTRSLGIDQYQITPASAGLTFHASSDLPVQLSPFAWNQAFSPVIRLSTRDLYQRGGSAGSLDARLDALAWGVKDGRKLAAPVIQIDHFRNAFSGGRWIFVNAELTSDFYNSAATNMIAALVERALRGSEEFWVRPEFPLYRAGEPVQLEVTWNSHNRTSTQTKVEIQGAVFPASQPQNRTDFAATPGAEPISVSAAQAPGLYTIEARLRENDAVQAVYRSGFWVADEKFLRSGPRLSVNQDYFELDGQPFAVIGTTYMSSEVQRLYFDHPNVYIWDQDLAQIHSAGLNMIRTGWWTGWDKLCDENGRPYERTLRTLEAYLLTARKNGLPVQFNFFAFLPEVLGGTNPYLDPEAVLRQRTLIKSVVARFHDVPWLAWDLINEPSISQHLWTMRPNGDPIELAKWNAWLNHRYPDRAALAAAWNLPAAAVTGTVPLPEDIEFTPRGMYVGHNSLKVFDYYLFAQDVFADWVRTMRQAIRDTGSQQLVTVGQDEGGIQDRLSPAYWGQLVDFTTNHSWWQNDYVLWDSLMAKQPGKAMLIQETGLQRELNLDETARRTPENEAALLDRKIASSFVQGAGAIEWLWNTNSYMTESNETPIGAIRTDGTEKPEAALLRAYAALAKQLGPHLRNPEPPTIAIVTSQAAQFSVMADFQLEAQRNAVRALMYRNHLPAYAIAENQIERLGTPKLTILPSAQALTEKTWQALLRYVNAGGNLLITGPIEYDEHWHRIERAARLHLHARVEPLTYHDAEIRLANTVVRLSFNQDKQNWLEAMRFEDGNTFSEIPCGSGRIFWASLPVELAEGTEAAGDLYAYVARRLGLTSQFESASPLPPGVLVYPAVQDDSVLYVLVSDQANEADVDLRDKTTGVHVKMRLPSQGAAIALISKKERSIVARYGF
jgi:hypothetical protein